MFGRNARFYRPDCPWHHHYHLGLVHVQFTLPDHPVRQETLPHDLVERFIEKVVQVRDSVRIEARIGRAEVPGVSKPESTEAMRWGQSDKARKAKGRACMTVAPTDWRGC